MKVLVTGASGFLGRNFLLKCPKDWNVFAMYYKSQDFLDFLKKHDLSFVTPLKCNLTEISSIKKSLAGNKFDECLFLAANTNIQRSVMNPFEDLTINAGSILRLFNEIKVDDLIYISSGAVYIGKKSFVNPEMEISPNLPYAVSKLAAENYVKFLKERGKAINRYVILRFFGAYGPYEPKRKIYTKLIDELYFKNKNEFTIYGDGKNFIDAMFIDDTIKGILNVIESEKRNLTVDFCSGDPLTIDELVKECGKILGKSDVRLKHIGHTEEHIEFYASNKGMHELFNFKPRISLSKGLIKLKKHLETI